VSVCGTVSARLTQTEVFLPTRPAGLPAPEGLGVGRVRRCSCEQRPGFSWDTRLRTPTRTFHSPCRFPRCGLHATVQKCRNIHLLSIDYAFRPRLRTDSPWDDCHCPGNLGLSMRLVFTVCVVTHASILSSTRSRAPRGCSFVAAWNALLPKEQVSPCSSPRLRWRFSPVVFSAQRTSTRALLRDL